MVTRSESLTNPSSPTEVETTSQSRTSPAQGAALRSRDLVTSRPDTRPNLERPVKRTHPGALLISYFGCPLPDVLPAWRLWCGWYCGGSLPRCSAWVQVASSQHFSPSYRLPASNRSPDGRQALTGSRSTPGAALPSGWVARDAGSDDQGGGGRGDGG